MTSNLSNLSLKLHFESSVLHSCEEHEDEGHEDKDYKDEAIGC